MLGSVQSVLYVYGQSKLTEMVGNQSVSVVFRFQSDSDGFQFSKDRVIEIFKTLTLIT